MMGSSGLFTTSATGAKQLLPLVRDFFGSVDVSSAASAREYEEVAHTLLRDALERSRKERIYGGANESWRDIGAAHGFKRFTKLEGAAQFYRVQGIVGAPLANVMNLLYAEQSSSIVARRNVFYGNALDGQILATLRARSTADPHQHQTLRWEAFKLETSSVTFKLDSCGLEYTGVALDGDGDPVGFKICHSIDLPQCRSLLKSHGIRRTHGTEVMTLRRSANHSYTEVTLEGSIQVTTPLPQAAIANFLTLIANQLGRVPMEIQAHRIAAMRVLDKSQWVRASERKNCAVCLGRFGMLSKKHHCRACGEVVCKSCFVAKPRRDEHKFCKKCVVVACAAEELVIVSTQPEPHQRPRHRRRHSSGASWPRESVRDSYASLLNAYTEVELQSSLLPIPRRTDEPMHTPSLQGQDGYEQHDHPVAEAKRMREDNDSLTASETSFGSSLSNGGYLSDRSRALSYELRRSEVSSQPGPENDVVFLDTKSMQRAASRREFASVRGHRRSRSQPTMLDVQSSLAHQRHLLHEIMQSCRAYRTHQTTTT